MSPATPPASTLSTRGRAAVLAAAFLGLVFDGFELGLMPVASLSVTKSLMGEAYTPAAGGDWFARYTAALMLGAAIGGIVLGRFGDRYGRSRNRNFCPDGTDRCCRNHSRRGSWRGRKHWGG